MSSPQTTGQAAPSSLISALLPDSGDELLWKFAETVFIDGGVDVAVSPVDQMLVAFARRLLSDPALGRHGLVQLPRHKHRSALMLAILAQLLCRRAPARLAGPVVLIGFDMGLANEIRSLSVRNVRRMNLSDGNPLSVHRLTRDGHISPLVGSRVGEVNRALIYFNTRVGEPELSCAAPLVVLDGTTVKNPAARARALQWALGLGSASIVAIGDLGDDGILNTMSGEGVVPSVLAFTELVAEELLYERGRAAGSTSTLSSAALLSQRLAAVQLHRVGSDELNEAVSKAVGSLSNLPESMLPAELDLPLKMLRNGMRLAAGVAEYKRACTENPRVGEMPDVRRLDRFDSHLPPRWRRWEQDRMPSLILGARTLWRELEEQNPKLDALWSLLDDLERTTSGRVLIRCHSKAAVRATLATLYADYRTPVQEAVWGSLQDRVEVATWRERYPIGFFEAQVLTAAAPPWEFSLLCGVEALTTHVLCYQMEERLLARQGERYARGVSGWNLALCRSLGAPALQPTVSPVPKVKSEAGMQRTGAQAAPQLSLAAALDQASGHLDPNDEAHEHTSVGGGTARNCIPVCLSDGRTWWCVDEHQGETPVVVITAGGPKTISVKNLTRGQRILVPAGEGTESIHARLVTASRSNSDVRSLNLVLGQFRAAARVVLSEAPSRAEAIERVRYAGAEAAGQISVWASGETIAPREPGDVEAVFVAAGRQCPDLRVVYEVAGRLRHLHRWLGVAIAAIRDGRETDVAELRRLVGDVADEIRDEFIVVDVESVGTARNVPGSFAGRVR